MNGGRAPGIALDFPAIGCIIMFVFACPAPFAGRRESEERSAAETPLPLSGVRFTRRYTRYSNRRTRIQTQRLIRAWLAGGGLALALLAAVCLFFSGGGRPRFEKGDFLVCVNGGGSVELYWPGASDQAIYEVEVRCGEVRSEKYCSRPAARFSGLPAGEELYVQVQAVAEGKSLFGKPRQVESWKTLKAKVSLPESLPAPEVTGSLKAGTASLRITGGGDLYEVFRTYELPAEGTANSVPVASAGAEELTVPLEGGLLRQLAVRMGWRQRGFVLCGPAAIPVEAGEPDLPKEGALSLAYRETAPRVYVLEWEGTQCVRFEVQRWAEGDWETLVQLAPGAHMRYDAGRLRSGSYHRFRVAALGGEGAVVKEEEVSFYASISPLYSTVWPIQSLTLYEDPGKGERLASVPGGTALCVLAEEGDWFRVRYGEEYGWLDSRFCMVNLPEYVGDYCAYDITNSYDSLFAVHGSPIRQITHQVVSGFENVRTEDGEFLVPYLYPCAKKLLAAAQTAREDGFRLKIYEAFRPQRATRFCYDTAEKQMNDPALTETGQQVGGTLYKLMTDNGRFGLGSFLARTISSHNRGIALDLTLERLDGGGELEMQSVIHDLSWYSETSLNNLNAKLLEGYMTGVGMTGLSSEWWHFQDDGARAAIGLNSSLYEGISAEGWTQDDGGWRYRRANGSFLRNTSAVLDGRTYSFDADGYAAG